MHGGRVGVDECMEVECMDGMLIHVRTHSNAHTHMLAHACTYLQTQAYTHEHSF